MSPTEEPDRSMSDARPRLKACQPAWRPKVVQYERKVMKILETGKKKGGNEEHRAKKGKQETARRQMTDKRRLTGTVEWERPQSPGRDTALGPGRGPGLVARRTNGAAGPYPMQQRGSQAALAGCP